VSPIFEFMRDMLMILFTFSHLQLSHLIPLVLGGNRRVPLTVMMGEFLRLRGLGYAKLPVVLPVGIDIAMWICDMLDARIAG